jgi:hypothetical protein
LSATDDDGRFEFRDLPPGRFILTATKIGFLPQHFGSGRPGIAAGVPIVLAAGEQATASLALTREGVIAGTLLLPPGVPTSALRIAVQRIVASSNGSRLMSTIGGLRAVDADGGFRIPGLVEAEYRLFVTAVGPMSRFLQADSEVMFQPTYYPGTAHASGAVAIRATPGRETDASFPVQLVRSSRVSGRVLVPDGTTLDSFQLAVVDEAAPVPRQPIDLRTEEAGHFVATGLAPGQYRVVARGAAKALQLWGARPLTVGGQDVDGFVVVLQPGVEVSGRVVFESAATAATAKPRARLSLLPVGTNPLALRPPAVETDADGRFVIPHAPPGEYRLEAVALSGNVESAEWALKSALTAVGTNVLDERLVLGADHGETNVIVTFTDQPTVLHGSIRDEESRPVTDFFLVAFSTDPQFRRAPTRRVVQTKPGSDGTFSFASLPAGEYHLCAISHIEPGQLADLAFLEQLIPAAIRITLAPGERKRQDLQVGSGR